MTDFSRITNVLTIAGSDSGGGAGIQADIKAISATGSYACSVITALTAQNTLGVQAIFTPPVDFIAAQLDSVFSDIQIDAVKIGMLSDADVIHVVADKLRQYQPPIIVLDPVMVATSGDLLLQSAAIDALKAQLLPLATVITPNLPEAATLLGCPTPSSIEQMEAMVNRLRQLNTAAILLKGGHLKANESLDLLIEAEHIQAYSQQRIETPNTHGTGCTLSAALASFLAQGDRLDTAVDNAKTYISKALEHADRLDVGHGHGPVNHFFAQNV